MSEDVFSGRDSRGNRAVREWTGSIEDERPTAEPIVNSSLRVLRRRKILAIAAFLVFAIPAGIYVKMRPPVYRATARLLVERNNEAASVMRDSAGASAPDDFFQTQLQLLRSRPVVVKAIQALKLWETPEFAPDAAIVGTSDEVSRTGLVERFLQHLTVVPTPGTHLVNIAFVAEEPGVAMRAANTLAETYISEQNASQASDSSKLMGWIDERLEERRRALAESEAALQRYMETNDAVSVQDRQNIVVQKLSDLNAALTRAKTERMAKEAHYQQVQIARDDASALDSLPIVLSNGSLQQLRGQLAELRQRELGMSQDLGDRHPDLIKLRSEIDLATRRLGAELVKLTESVKSDFLGAQAVEEGLVRALEAQKQDVVSLNQKTIDYGSLQRQVASDRQIYERLLSESQTRGVTGGASDRTIRIVEAAEQPLGPVGPQNTRDLLLVLVAALVLAVGLPLTVEAMDHRVKTPADVEQRLHLSCLSMVPLLRGEGDTKRHLLAGEADGFTESFRRIRAAIRSVATQSQIASRILVTSAAPGEGKSLVAANLAVALARAGRRVLLVDADLRRPTVHTQFDLEIAPGLSNLLRRDGEPQACIRATSVPNLFVLPSGTNYPDAAELLSSPHLQTTLGVLEGRFNWIVFDSPPVGPVADACVIGRLAPQTIFVVAAGSTPAGAALAALRQLDSAGAKVLGVVLNRVDLERSAYYYGPYAQTTYAAYHQQAAGKSS